MAKGSLPRRRGLSCQSRSVGGVRSGGVGAGHAAIIRSAVWKDPLGCTESRQQVEGPEGWAENDEVRGAWGQGNSDRARTLAGGKRACPCRPCATGRVTGTPATPPPPLAPMTLPGSLQSHIGKVLSLRSFVQTHSRGHSLAVGSFRQGQAPPATLQRGRNRSLLR